MKVDAPSSTNLTVTELLHQQLINNVITHPKSSEYFVFKLDRLTEKEWRYVNHKLFLSRCFSENAITNGLRLELEATIVNYNETFLNDWYERLKQHSVEFIKDIITFWEKAVTELKAEIENTEKKLKNLENSTLQEVQNTINFNQNIRDRSLKQNRLKKFNHLIYGPRKTQQYSWIDKEPTRENETTEKIQTSYTTTVRKVNSKTILFPKRG